VIKKRIAVFHMIKKERLLHSTLKNSKISIKLVLILWMSILLKNKFTVIILTKKVSVAPTLILKPTNTITKKMKIFHYVSLNIRIKLVNNRTITNQLISHLNLKFCQLLKLFNPAIINNKIKTLFQNKLLMI
jgi:hypothetical protein